MDLVSCFFTLTFVPLWQRVIGVVINVGFSTVGWCAESAIGEVEVRDKKGRETWYRRMGERIGGAWLASLGDEFRA